MRIWGFWRKENEKPKPSPDDQSGTASTSSVSDDNTLTPAQFLADVQESIPEVNRENIGRLIVGLLVFFAFLGLFTLILVGLSHIGSIESTGYTGVFVANLLSSMGVVFPLPVSPGTLVTITVAGAANPLLVGLLAGVAGTLGEFTAYWLGYGGERFIRFQNHRQYKVAEKWMGRYGGLTIAFFALVPFFMFDFVGLAAGALRYPFKKFLVFCLIGRVPRCLIEAYLGQWILDNIMPHLPNWINDPFIG